MMQSQYIEALVGTLVLAIAGYILWFGYSNSNHHDEEGYVLNAYFNRVDGISAGNDVKLAGIKIGTVKNLKIDPKSYMAALQIFIEPSVKIPNDSSIAVVSDGLLGGKFIDISPGGSEEHYANGDVIEHTQSSINLESLIGHMVFNQDKKQTPQT